MADDIDWQLHEDGPVDHEQAAQLAEAVVDKDLRARACALCDELDELHPRLVELTASLSECHLELIRHSEDAFLDRGYRVLHGLDTTMTYNTHQRAEELVRTWSGERGLSARLWRLANLAMAAIGEVGPADGATIEADLAEEAGR